MTTNPAPDPSYTAFGPDPAPPQAAAPPVFGRRKPDTPVAPAVKRVSFVLLTYRGNDPIENTLTARADIDTASVFSLGRTGQSVGAQIEAIRKLLMRTLVDDDGIGVHQLVEQVVPNPDGDDPGDMVTVESLVPRDEDGEPDPDYTPAWSMADVAFRTPDGEVFDEATDATNHCREHGSSLRRFAAIMDDDSLWVEQSALEEIIDYLMTQAADRPTRRSSARSRSRQRTGR